MSRGAIVRGRELFARRLLLSLYRIVLQVSARRLAFASSFADERGQVCRQEEQRAPPSQDIEIAPGCSRYGGH